MPVAPPPLGRDPLLVGAYAVPSPGRRVSRVFLPLTGVDGSRDVSWTVLAAGKGEALSADTDLYDLMDRSAADAVHPQGRASEHVVQRLLAAVERSVAPREEIVVASWPGYADAVVVGEEVELSGPLGPWAARDFVVTRSTLGHLVEVARHGAPFPVYLWTPDHRFVLSCPWYSDSLFVTSDELAAGDFRAAGLEASLVPHDGPLAITGD